MGRSRSSGDSFQSRFRVRCCCREFQDGHVLWGLIVQKSLRVAQDKAAYANFLAATKQLGAAAFACNSFVGQPGTQVQEKTVGIVADDKPDRTRRVPRKEEDNADNGPTTEDEKKKGRKHEKPKKGGAKKEQDEPEKEKIAPALSETAGPGDSAAAGATTSDDDRRCARSANQIRFAEGPWSLGTHRKNERKNCFAVHTGLRLSVVGLLVAYQDSLHKSRLRIWTTNRSAPLLVAFTGFMTHCSRPLLQSTTMQLFSFIVSSSRSRRTRRPLRQAGTCAILSLCVIVRTMRHPRTDRSHGYLCSVQ